jgi:hypothetical protein
MPSINQIRGALLEEIVLLLLERSGYHRIHMGDEGTRSGRAGLEVEGRGSPHQIDALVTPIHSHAFIYPIRLMVEAKCETNPIGLATVRSVVGTLFDINQNFLARRLADGREVRIQRFNYHAAMFAVNGYSANAEQFAMAHQVFPIDYSHVAAMRPVVDALLALRIEDFREIAERRGKRNLTEIRTGFRALLETRPVRMPVGLFSERGVAKVRDQLQPGINQLSGSYYGMIEGVYPVHLISRRPIPIEFIRRQGVIPCEIRVSNDEQTWALEPSEVTADSPDFFRLEFTIPEFIAEMLSTRTEEDGARQGPPQWLRIAEVKANYMRFIDVTTVDEGQLIPFRLALDVNWLSRYVVGRHARDAGRRSRRRLS